MYSGDVRIYETGGVTTMKKLSIVIPCYRSQDTITNVVERVITTVEQDKRYDYEIICINDCSPDDTISVLKELAKNKRIKVLDFSRNFGQHSALMAGFNHVTGDIIVCLDDDGENPPEEMFRLIDKLEEGYDLVSAKYVDESRSFIRKIGTKVSFAMSHYLIGRPKDIDLNSFYVFRRYIADEIIKYKNAYPFVHGLILRVSRNMANVEMKRAERLAGESGYNFRRLLSLWMNGFTAFSEKPLQIASIIGVLSAMVGFVYSIFIILRKLFVPEIAMGYSSVMAAILFFSGLIMLFLGLLGEYIGRIYICINNAPQYAIREKINVDSEKE